MTITEFLEARIAEDEKRAAYYGPLTLGMRRLLAECAAKRAMLDIYRDERAGTRFLKAIAAVYKGHPDYQQEWAA